MITANPTGFFRKVAGARHALGHAMGVALKTAMAPEAREMVGVGGNGVNRDTNRLVRGYMEGLNEAGVGPGIAGVGRHTRPPIKPSHYLKSARVEARLIAQVAKWKRFVDYWNGIVFRYLAAGRRDRWYDDAVKKRNKAEASYKAAVEELQALRSASGATAIAIFGRNRARLDIALRTKVYGGRGKMTVGYQSAVITVRNLEPHSSFQDRKHGNVKKMLAATKRAGNVFRAKKAFLEGLGVRGKLGGFSGRA